VIGVDIDTGRVRRVTDFPAWHPMVDPQGRSMVADTTFPDQGLFLFSAAGGDEPQLLCLSGSSNQGKHWNADHCPYDDGPVEVYAPQSTHPHPNFSPDGRWVVFTSDRSGHAQVYKVRLED
jgi:oligogalacturonide lyase